MIAVAGRFDHAVVAVRDLDRAMAAFTAIGFDVALGGVHTGLGTHNAIVRFGLDYIELLAVNDEAQARAQPARGALLDFLTRHEGLVGYAVATADIDGLAARFVAKEVPAVGPFPMSRTRPDGRELSWRLLIPAGLAWRRPWPFVIQWDAPDPDRMTWERPGRHPNGANAVRGVRVLVRDRDAARVLYAEAFGLRATTGTRFTLGVASVELLEAADDKLLASELADEGEGLHELVLGTADLALTRRTLKRAGLELREDGGGLHIDYPLPAGTRLAFIPSD